jgi:hypothetical protein
MANAESRHLRLRPFAEDWFEFISVAPYNSCEQQNFDASISLACWARLSSLHHVVADVDNHTSFMNWSNH